MGILTFRVKNAIIYALHSRVSIPLFLRPRSTSHDQPHRSPGNWPRLVHASVLVRGNRRIRCHRTRCVLHHLPLGDGAVRREAGASPARQDLRGPAPGADLRQASRAADPGLQEGPAHRVHAALQAPGHRQGDQGLRRTRGTAHLGSPDDQHADPGHPVLGVLPQHPLLQPADAQHERWLLPQLRDHGSHLRRRARHGIGVNGLDDRARLHRQQKVDGDVELMRYPGNPGRKLDGATDFRRPFAF
ncbi:MAG: hypothetical protein JWM52_704 [Candidatus Saccharibacteria bacterium]|nr:hypothetical protein [Candidatus Saccharibacteria bacterium]